MIYRNVRVTATRPNAPKGSGWTSITLPYQDIPATDRRDFLANLAGAYGKRTKLRTHPTTKHAQADFARVMGDGDTIFAHVDWFEPAAMAETCDGCGRPATDHDDGECPEKGPEMETRTITALRPIRPYVGPSWLVEPTEPLADEAAEIAAVTELGFVVLDRNVHGWGGHNAIIAVDHGDRPTHYLATLA